MIRNQRTKARKLWAVLLSAVVLISAAGFPTETFAETSRQDVSAAVADTAKYVSSMSKNAGMSDVGGEWAVMDLARSGCEVPDSIYQNYYKNLEKTVKEKGGILHKKKYTEYSRVILAVTAIGKDPRNVAGYNLLEALADYDAVIWQGINGPIWALIALDTGNYEIPKVSSVKTQATRQMYIDCILGRQLNDGGWSLTGGITEESKSEAADVDITAMALQALAKYQNQAKVKEATDKALSCLSRVQLSNGGFESWGTENSESCVQVITALCELGISVDDSRFVKSGNTMLDNLLKNYYIKGQGFKHTKDGGSNGMATEQGFYGIIAVSRQLNGQSSLYRMSDHITFPEAGSSSLPENKQNQEVIEVSFSDIEGSKNREAILVLAGKGIISGMGDGTFAPSANMTRAQFAAIVTRAMGYEPKASDVFRDVPKTKWYAGYIGTAYKQGIVNGRSADTFDPEGLITRQEAAVMVANAAKLCGMETEMDEAATLNVLAQFGDYVQIAGWARPAMAFCYGSNIYDQADLDTNPGIKITRGEIAQMLYNMLTEAMVL